MKHYRGFLSETDARRCMKHLTILRRGGRLSSGKIFGNKIPREYMAFSDEGVQPYKFTGSKSMIVRYDWPSWLTTVKRRVEKVTGETYNYVLINYYKDGQSSVGWHADDEKAVVPGSTIASVSVGETRLFRMRINADLHTAPEIKNYHLESGDLLVMARDLQQFSYHCLSKTAKSDVGPRFNLTFRKNLISV